MKNAVIVSAEIGGKQVSLESGVLARQASGAVSVRLGDTMVFSAVTNEKEPRKDVDYFPLQVEYRERYYAAGRFPGGYIKREARPSEKEILTARLTDRPIRPLFPKGYRCDVQVNNMLMSYDDQNDSDTLSMIAGSASLVVSEIPFLGPIGAVRVGRVDGKFVINPTHEERAKSDLDLVYAATRDYPIMIEGACKELSEADVIAAMKAAHAECVKLVDLQLELRRKLGLPDKARAADAPDTEYTKAARELCGAEFADAMLTADRNARREKKNAIKDRVLAALKQKFPEMTDEDFAMTIDEIEIESLRRNVLEKNRRGDGRGFDDIRALSGEVAVIPRTHGSAVFSRGETQSVGIVTLGAMADAQKLDPIAGGPAEKSFMLHYNFPPYSTGEVGRLGSTGRREIGHGNLAERSLRQCMPDDYPYTVRIVSEIMGSNGSSSMASVCVGTLALMDAGVTMTAPVAGMAMGLVTGNGKAKVLTDIAGEEDHCGDMDFKVAGTTKGITGFQVDLKISGLEWNLVQEAFEKARAARLKVLDFMAGVIAQPRPDISPYAPRITTLKINTDDIGGLIGPGGKNIRRITELSGAQIDIEDDGTVKIFAKSEASMKIAVQEVKAVSAEAEVGMIYEGKVTGIKPFGAFVEILPGQDGLVHISEMADFRVNSVEDVCKIGDMMRVKCIGVDNGGRIKLSRREAMRDGQS